MGNVKTFKRKKFVDLNEVVCRILIKKDNSNEILINFSEILPKKITNKLIAYLKDKGYKPILMDTLKWECKIKDGTLYCVIEIGKNGKNTKIIKPNKAHLESNIKALDYDLIVGTAKEILDWIDDNSLLDYENWD
jgi:hypothetical protein